ncbi:MAG: VWA domain-containing protein [Thiopseudomonas sp.]|nr:VWA domain-containing protein [Thiopseudomonas sp.]
MNTLTELAFILDRSGSMTGLEDDTLGGYNSMLEKQRNLYNDCRITTVLFDHEVQILHDRLDIRLVTPVTREHYQPRGNTALLDAMALTINRLGAIQQYTPPAQRAERVMVVIITDGMENASRQYSVGQLRKLVERQQQRFGWEFIFLGANMDAIGVACSYGIAPEKASNFVADKQGATLNYETLALAVTRFRRGERDFHQELDSIRRDEQLRGRRAGR